MIDIDQFPDSGPLALAYRNCLESIDAQQRVLWRYIRGEKSNDGKLIAYFLDCANEPLAALAESENKLSVIEKDAEEFSKILGQEFKSMRELSDKLKSAKIIIQNAELDARKSYELELKKHRELLSVEVENLDAVKSAGLARDRVVAKYQPIIDDLEKRKQSANLILEKY